MKIIFFAGIPKKTEEMTLNDINGTAALYSYFLRKEFQKMGIETEYCAARPGGAPVALLDKIEVPRGDHIISTAQKGFTVRCSRSKILLSNVRKSIKGKITSICDYATPNPIEDVIFYAIQCQNPYRKNSYIGWACDHEVLHPEQDPTKTRILIDHAYYGRDKRDLTEKISLECLKFQGTFKGKEVIIRRFSGPEGVETVTPSNVYCGAYNRSTSMPYPKACEEYKKANFFFVTHPESLGLSVLESAACGAYVLSPEGYIRSRQLKQVRHVSFKRLDIPWDLAIRKMAPISSVNVTKDYNWTIMANKILNELNS